MAETKATNITWHEGRVARSAREAIVGQKGVLIWFTGLSASGKSTVAFTVEHALVARGQLAYAIDGDNIRHGLNANLGFSAEDRSENIRRIAEVGKLFIDAGVITCAAFISPYVADRQAAREVVGHEDFVEVYLNPSLAVCEKRDPKGLYKKARAGEITGFTGIDDPYEPPVNPQLTIDTATITPQEAAAIVIGHLEERGNVPTLST